MDNLYHFLNLVGFIALLLGGVGVASAIHVHVKQKLNTVAVLRCLGTSVAQAFAIYLAQGMALGAFGATVGAALGVVVQMLIPKVLGDFIPFSFQFHTSWFAIARAMDIAPILPLSRSFCARSSCILWVRSSVVTEGAGNCATGGTGR